MFIISHSAVETSGADGGADLPNPNAFFHSSSKTVSLHAQCHLLFPTSGVSHRAKTLKEKDRAPRLRSR